jgi:hypothetical protein
MVGRPRFLVEPSGGQMIDSLVANRPGRRAMLRLLFAAEPFPGYQVELFKVREEYQEWRVALHKAGFAQRCSAILTRHRLGPTRELNRFIDRVPSLPTMQTLYGKSLALAPDRFSLHKLVRNRKRVRAVPRTKSQSAFTCQLTPAGAFSKGTRHSTLEMVEAN